MEATEEVEAMAAMTAVAAMAAMAVLAALAAMAAMSSRCHQNVIERMNHRKNLNWLSKNSKTGFADLS